MRKLLGIAAICAVIMFGFLQLRSFPVERKALIGEKYEGFSGVLRAWFYCDFTCKKSLIGWVNRCAEDFERDHPGVYIEVESVTAEMLREYGTMRTPPDMIFFSPGAIEAGRVHGETALAMGGYIGIARTDGEYSIAECALPAAAGRDYAAAAICIGERAAEIPEIGIDLGLRAMHPVGADDVLNFFIRGEIACTVVTSGQLAELIRRRDAGVIDGWTYISGDMAFTDQLLIGAATGGGERDALSQSFIQSLTTAENQTRLADFGALSPLTRIYPDGSDYAAMDAAYASARRIVKKIYDFNKADATGILNALRTGGIGLDEARQRVARLYDETSVYK